MSSIYNIDLKRVVRWNLRRKYRKPRILALLYAFVAPVNVLYQDFLRFRDAKIYQLGITPQVCYLERLLNDRYDYTKRRIYITDAIDYPPVYLYQEDELKPLYLYQESENKPVYLYTDGEAGEMKDDFIIWVPNDIIFEQAEMISLVKVYKLAGTKFKIQRF